MRSIVAPREAEAFDKFSTNYKVTQWAAITALMAGTVPLALVGPPGHGKTTFVSELAKRLDLYLQSHIPSGKEPSDYGGTSFFADDPEYGKVQDRAPLRWALELRERINAGERALLLFDEVTSAAPATLAPLMEGIRTGTFTGIEIDPTKLIRVLLYNPEDIAVNGNSLGAPFANRLCIVPWRLSAEDYITGEMHNWPEPALPEATEDYEAAVKRYYKHWTAMMCQYLRRAPEDLDQLPDSYIERGEAFASPRSWENMRVLLAHASAAGRPQAVLNILANGTIGSAVANRFFEYCAQLNLPNPWELMDNPKDYVPNTTRFDISVATASSLINAISTVPMEDPTRIKKWENIGVVLEKMYDAGLADVVFPFIKGWISSIDMAKDDLYNVSESFGAKLVSMMSDMKLVSGG